MEKGNEWFHLGHSEARGNETSPCHLPTGRRASSALSGDS